MKASSTTTTRNPGARTSSYLIYIGGAVIISMAISFSLYFHHLVKPEYLELGGSNHTFRNHSFLYLAKSNSFANIAGSILDVFQRGVSENEYEESHYCDNSTSIWCSIPMPAESHFRFPSPPVNLPRWKLAQEQAASGEQVLLKKILKSFPFYMDFLDGDIQFRLLHNVADVFVDGFGKNDLSPLVGPFETWFPNSPRKKFDWEGQEVAIPKPYNFRHFKRAAIVKLGYGAFVKGANEYFQGVMKGEGGCERKHLFTYWNRIKGKTIDVPFILVHAMNENWGLLSTHLPNRTGDWGKCCSAADHSTLLEILNHNKTLMFLTNQHYNFTHPKLLAIPRGMPINKESKVFGVIKRVLWDTMRVLSTKKKTNFIFSASSKAFSRMQIMDCIRKKFDPTDLEAVSYGESLKNRLDASDYYVKLGSAMVGIALPGVGYDTYRLWETLTLGAVAVVEKGIGLDKTLWKLPALIVEDFDQVTPSLLRSAYLEALYRKDEFEFERLSQQFWWKLIGDVASQMSSQPLYDRFPPNLAEDDSFARPAVPYDCGVNHDRCGKGTKRTPRSYC